MTQRITTVLIAALALVAIAAPASAGEHRLGVGVHYWKNLDSISDDLPDFQVDDDGLTTVLSYQYVAGLVRFELDAEYFESGFEGSTDWAVAPQAYVLIGRGLYGGIGVGTTYSNDFGSSFSDPYFIAKAGFDLLLLPKIHLDLNADYRFANWDEIDDYSTETITLGATVRFTF